METKVLKLGDIEVNCYLLSTDNAAVVIDAGFRSDEVLGFLKSAKDKERLIILTHAHYDHIGYALELSRETDTKIAIGKFDNDALSNPYINLSVLFHTDLEPFTADLLLRDGDEFSVGDIEFKAIHTAGHTVGGISLLSGEILYSGDTLFRQSIGRTDFLGGNFGEIEKSVKMLYSTLPESTRVLPGHGEETTIGFEKKNNPYIRG